MAQRLSGIWFKLVQPDGFYLGILCVPQSVAEGIEKGGRWRCQMSVQRYVSTADDRLVARAPDRIYYFDFVPMDHIMRDAIAVFGISLSDLNKEPGFALIPSKDYIDLGKPAPANIAPPEKKTSFPELDFA